MQKDDWWKEPDCLRRLLMNTGETKKVYREEISHTPILQALLAMGDELFGEDVALGFAPRYRICTTVDASTASFSICRGAEPLSHCYLATDSEDNDAMFWRAIENQYLELTDQSCKEWSLPEKPESTPWLTVIRLVGDLKCDCEECIERRRNDPVAAALEPSLPGWLEEVECCMAWLLIE